MPAFELAAETGAKPVEVLCTQVQTRPEFHGEDKVPAFDMFMQIEGPNTLLNLLDPEYWRRLYCNRALEAGQRAAIPEELQHRPDLTMPKMEPRKFFHCKGERHKGYRLIVDWGLGEDADSNLDFTGVTLSGWWFEVKEGGSVTIGWMVSYAGDELNDQEIIGRVVLMKSEKLWVRLIASPALVVVRGKSQQPAGAVPDAQPDEEKVPGQARLDGIGGDAGGEEGGDGFRPNADDDGDVVLPPGSPEAALAASEKKLH